MTPVHRAVVLLGLLLATSGALLGALGGSPVAAASIVIAGALVVVAGLLLRRRTRAQEPRPVVDGERAAPSAEVSPPVDAGDQPSETLRLWQAETAATITTAPAPGEAPAIPAEAPAIPAEAPAIPAEAPAIPAEAPAIPSEAPAIPAEDAESRERQAIREAELAREAELNAIADELRALRSRDLSSIHIPEWKARIETWVDADLKARAERGEDVPPQAAEWMRDFGEIPVKDWRRHMLRHLRRLGYRNYREGEW
jgi:hypothetical protein